MLLMRTGAAAVWGGTTPPERERDLNSPVKGHFDFLEKKETTKSLDHDFLFNEKCGQPP